MARRSKKHKQNIIDVVGKSSDADPMIVSANHKTHSVTDVMLAIADIDLVDKNQLPIKRNDLIMWNEDPHIVKPAFESLLDLYFDYDVLIADGTYKINSILDRRVE